MTQFSMFPWETQTATGDGAAPYTQEQANKFFRYFDVQNWVNEGVVKGSVLGELAVTGTASPLSVEPGAAICYGRYWSDATEQVAVSTPVVGTTGGRVVLRADWATNEIRLAVKVNTDGVGTPPDLTQTVNSVWEISLATFTITVGGVITVTDARTFRRPTTVAQTGEIGDKAVTDAKLRDSAAVSVIGRAPNSVGAPADIVAGTNTVLGRLAGSVGFAQIITAQIADDAVNYAKAGAQIFKMYQRQGGSATDWNAAGGSNYTPGAITIQGGSKEMSGIAAGGYGSDTIFYPTPFSSKPLLFFSVNIVLGVDPYDVAITVDPFSQTGSNVDIRIYNNGASPATVDYSWLAIGPE